MTATEIIFEELYKVVDEIKNTEELPIKINLLSNVENIIKAIHHLKEAGTKPRFDRIIEQAMTWRKKEEDKQKII